MPCAGAWPSSAAPVSRVAVDHLDLDQVKALSERIRTSHGHVDVLVNNIWGGELLKGGPAQWNTPIWAHDLDDGLRIVRLAVDTHLITSHHVLPLLIDRPGGLLVEVTDGTLDNFGVSESNWRDAVERGSAPPDFALSESPRYVGRAVAALAADPERSRWTQQSVSSARLAHEYGFTDLDGSQPDIWRHIEDVRPPV
jgi:short chain dehydrogenase